MMITEKLIFSGVQFNINRTRDFDNTDIKTFMDRYLSRDLVQSRGIENQTKTSSNVAKKNENESIKKNKIIYNDSNYSLSFVYATSKNADGKYVHELKLHIPMVAGEEATDKVITLEETISNNPNVVAYNLIDGNKNLATENISIAFVSPYVVKVTTPAGSFLFDFKANDKRILMESLSKVNDSNYTEIFANIDKNISELPADFICPTCGHPASDFEKV